MDQTFATSPPHFDRVLIIMSILRGTCKLSRLKIGFTYSFLSYTLIILFQLGVPAVYALLPNRKSIKYIYLFNVLFATAKQFNKTLDPQLIMTDFEPAIEKTIRLKVYFSSTLFTANG